jgi:iron complex transport system permease protein
MSTATRPDAGLATAVPRETTTKPLHGGLWRRVPLGVLLAAGLLVLAASAVLALGVGAVSIPPGEVAGALWRAATGAPQHGPYDFIVVQLRLPRVIEAMIVGAGLATAGAIVQAIVRNPIADPYVLGLSSGASLGAVFVITTLGIGFAGSLTLPFAAFAGAAATGTLVFLLARTGAGLAAGPLVMVGIATASLLSGVTSFLLLRGSPDASQDVIFWLLGSLSGAQWRLAAISGALVGAALTAALLAGRRLSILALGDESAAALGMRPGLARTGFFALAALLTGAAVSVSGAIGFIGLVMPNLARMLVGADSRRVIPAGALIGAVILLWADTAARTILAPSEVPIGILTAFIGVPIFIAAVRTRQGDLP